MKQAKTFFNFGAWTFVFLGCGHLLADIAGRQAEPPQIVQDMQNYYIQFFGNHSLYQFFVGFSLVMGLMFVFYGLCLLLVIRSAFEHLKTDIFIFNVVSSLLLFAMAVNYFHVLAYGLCALATLFFSLSAYQHQKARSNA